LNCVFKNKSDLIEKCIEYWEGQKDDLTMDILR